MAITITKAEIKRKCRIASADTTFDSDIDALIAEMQPCIEYDIASVYIDDTGNTRLQATLKLGIVEMLCGELLQQIAREPGASESLSIAGVSIGSVPAHGAKLMAQGNARLAPFRKATNDIPDEAYIASTTSDSDRAFDGESMKVW